MTGLALQSRLRYKFGVGGVVAVDDCHTTPISYSYYYDYYDYYDYYYYYY